MGRVDRPREGDATICESETYGSVGGVGSRGDEGTGSALGLVSGEGSVTCRHQTMGEECTNTSVSSPLPKKESGAMEVQTFAYR